MMICQCTFEGHCKDDEAGASSGGDPQTNAFTSEGIKPWALRVRVGLNCAGLLKIQPKHPLLPFPRMFQMPQIGPGLCCSGKKKVESSKFPAAIEVQIFVSHTVDQTGEYPCPCHSVVWVDFKDSH